MEKKLALILIIGIGGLAAYELLKKPAAPKVNASGITTDDLSQQIDMKATQKPVQQTLPKFGVPVDVMQAKKAGIFAKSNYTSFASANGMKNYVDVKNNAFFKPELGVFHK